VQSLARRLENGGVLPCTGVAASAQPFLAALLRRLFPQRPIVVVTEGLRSQESAQQDLATWMGSMHRLPQPSTLEAQPLFYPAWEFLPHDARLPHADIISERLETLVALAAEPWLGRTESRAQDNAARNTQHAPLVVSSVAALLQRTFSRNDLSQRMRSLGRGQRADPLDLADWLEQQAYEPEARVTQKGEMSLRGGILDVYPLTSPWPVRLEFFGDELESLRYFDPLTQVSREEITAVTIPPAGELGILKKAANANIAEGILPATALGTLLDYLPPQSVFLLCDP
jgi:transcription-repair coupling factor (superfamily II helicase)